MAEVPAGLQGASVRGCARIGVQQLSDEAAPMPVADSHRGVGKAPFLREVGFVGSAPASKDISLGATDSAMAGPGMPVVRGPGARSTTDSSGKHFGDMVAYRVGLAMIEGNPFGAIGLPPSPAAGPSYLPGAEAPIVKGVPEGLVDGGASGA